MLVSSAVVQSRRSSISLYMLQAKIRSFPGSFGLTSGVVASVQQSVGRQASSSCQFFNISSFDFASRAVVSVQLTVVLHTPSSRRLIGISFALASGEFEFVQSPFDFHSSSLWRFVEVV